MMAQEPNVTADSKEIRGKDACYGVCCYSKWPTDDEMVATYVEKQEAMSEQDRMRVTERWFQSQFSKAIIGWNLKAGEWKPVAYLSIALGFAYGAFMVYQAVQLTPPTAQEEWFPKAHMYTDLIAR